MLTKITITNENDLWYRLNKKDEDSISFDFKEGVNVIIGKNGIGKSTIVKAIQNAWVLNKNGANKGIKHETKKINDKESLYILTAEENNPKNQLANVSPTDQYYAEKIQHWFFRSELSSGMNTTEYLEDAMALAENARTIILDEPEQALDAESLLKLIRRFKKISKSTQIIIVSHHPAFILEPTFNIIEFDEKKPYKPSVEKLIKSIKL